MGEKEQGLATAREAGSGMATGRVFPETNVAQTDQEGGGIAVEGEGVRATAAGGSLPALESNLNSSRSDIYRSAAGDPATEGGGAGADPSALASNLNSSRSNIYRTAGDKASEAPIPGKPSKEQRTQMEIAADDSGEGDTDDERLSTNMTIERQTPKRDFGDRMKSD